MYLVVTWLGDMPTQIPILQMDCTFVAEVQGLFVCCTWVTQTHISLWEPALPLLLEVFERDILYCQVHLVCFAFLLYACAFCLKSWPNLRAWRCTPMFPVAAPTEKSWFHGELHFESGGERVQLCISACGDPMISASPAVGPSLTGQLFWHLCQLPRSHECGFVSGVALLSCPGILKYTYPIRPWPFLFCKDGSIILDFLYLKITFRVISSISEKTLTEVGDRDGAGPSGQSGDGRHLGSSCPVSTGVCLPSSLMFFNNSDRFHHPLLNLFC